MGFTSSDFYCTKCGEKNFCCARRTGQQREPGHLKRLWCWHCQEERNCAEVKQHNLNYTYEMFRIEFENGNFDTEGNRKNKKIRQFISEVENG